MTESRVTGAFRTRRAFRLVCAIALAVAVPVTVVMAEPPASNPLPAPNKIPIPALGTDGPACPPANAGLPERLPGLPTKAPRPLTGAGSTGELVEGLTQNDATFEVLVGQGRILTTKVDLAVKGKQPALVAVGDPTVADFSVISARQIRIEGRRIGVTDLSIITPDNQTYSFEVRVVSDLHVLRGQLHCLFPDASLKLSQLRDHVIVEGEARDAAQVARILETIQAYLASVQTGQTRQVTSQQRVPPAPAPKSDVQPKEPDQPGVALPEQPLRGATGTVPAPRIVNLIRVPGAKQVLLKVRVAELNRTAFRQIGTDILFRPPGGGVVGTQIGGASVTANATRNGALSGFAQLLNTGSTTAFAIFDRADFGLLFSALRRNSMLKVLAEPNLVALNGHAANFLAGGEFPVPVPQIAASGVAPTVTVQFKEFGVRLGFLPTILDGEVVRLAVDPEVSTIDPTLGTVLVAGGSPVPGLNTRRAHTVVEMREGQTLAIAGLLQLSMDGTTTRLPGLGDLPVLGPFFSNTTSNRIEKELIVLVTPYLVDTTSCGQVPPSPGDDVASPSDFELYCLNRIEGRTDLDWRPTTQYEKQLPKVRALLKLDAANVRGPFGHCEP